MKRTNRRWAECFGDEDGFVVSTEVVMVATVALLGLIVSFASVRDSVVSELSDLAGAVQDLNQAYSFNEIVGHSGVSPGSSFADQSDWCDDNDDASGVNDNCITFSDPSNESDSGAGGDPGGGDPGGGDPGGDDFGDPADGDLISDNFQDGNGGAPFNLQVRNTTNSDTEWRAVLSSVPYASIPGLNAGNYDLEITPNADGTFQYVFTGTTPLGPFQNITITGGVPTPPGVGGTSNVDLFIPN